jgi:hypothetical protein
MAFFSWFKSKSVSPATDKPEISSSAKPATESDPAASILDTSTLQGVPRFRETDPQSNRAAISSAGSNRPARTTIDIPLQSLWQSLPEGLAQKSAFLDFRRRIQIPRKEVRINDTDHTGTVSLYVLHAACPEMFAAPVPSIDNRSTRFSLPAWERVRTAEIVDITPSPELEKAPSGLPLEEKTAPPTRIVDDRKQTNIEEGVAKTQSAISDGETRRVETDGSGSGRKIRVSLLPLLRSLPPELVSANLLSLPGANSEIELPFDLIHEQLAEGRVSLPIRTFLKALPDSVRSGFGEINPSVQIPIPLKEIFRYLPTDALPLRSDQQTEEVSDSIDTPFSGTARQEAARFHSGAGGNFISEPIDPQLELPSGPDDQVEPASSSAEPTEPGSVTPPADPLECATAESSAPDFSALQSVFLTEERLDLPGIVDRISGLPGLQSSLLSTMDGRKLAGKLDDDRLERSALTSFPALFREVKTRLDDEENHSLETLTLCWRQEQVSIFSDGRLCLTVRHHRRPFKPGVREKLVLVFSRLADALSSSEISVVHADH